MVARSSFFQEASALLEEDAVLERSLFTTKAGSLGTGIVAASLLSRRTAMAMVGRSLGSSCTHNSPTFTHLENSFVLHVSLSVWSISSKTLSSFHSFHAWDSSESCRSDGQRMTKRSVQMKDLKLLHDLEGSEFGQTDKIQCSSSH